MTIVEERPEVVAEPPGPEHRATGILGWVTTADHKRIGLAYIVTSFVFFFIGGAMAELIRLQLAQPNQDIVSEDTYNQLFTMHGTIMLLLFVSPFALGIANYFVPLQVGAKDMAFPRLNALGYWLTLFAGIVMLGGFATKGGAAKFGWYGYAPLSDGVRSPNVGGDLWIVGIALLGIAGVITALNIIVTVSTMRAPGMTMFRMPIFTWNMFVTSLLILMTFPVLTTAGVLLFFDRQFNAHIFDANNGGYPLLWQHLFWWFGHPEVYILVLPYFGVFTEIFAVFSRRPVFGYKALVFATLAIGFLSVGVWAHHMFTTGAVLLPFFSFMTMLIAVPTGVKFFNWIGTMWGGHLNFKQPLVWGIGFLLTFLLGGLSGPMLASAPLDFHLSDSYFVVAHFHYVLFGGSVFGVFAAVYYWYPKWTGRMLNERLGWIHFILTFVGFHLTFMVQHVLGMEGMPRRIQTYTNADGWGALNLASSIGAFLLGISTFPFLWNVWRSYRHGELAGRNPWDAQTLEWATASPPVPENYDEPLPPIRSERPVWDANHPEGEGDVPLMADPLMDPSERFAFEVVLFGALSLFLILGGIIYGVASREAAGTILLLLTAAFAAIVAGYLLLQDRLERTAAGSGHALGPVDEDMFLPHASVWPFEMGAGMALTGTGVVLGWALLVPGLVLVVHSMAGWMIQSRHRRPQ